MYPNKHKQSIIGNKDKKISRPLVESKTYTDPFLKDKVDLSPSAYNVYLQKNKKAKLTNKWGKNNNIEQRKKADIIDTKKPEKIDDKAKFDTKDATDVEIKPAYQPTRIFDKEEELDEKESFLDTESIINTFKKGENQFNRANFKQRPKEKNFVLNENEPESDTENINQPNNFDQQKVASDNETIRGNKPKKGLINILSIFSSDFFWHAIAIFMLLAVVLFFFQGIQPLVLSRYALLTEQKSNKMIVRYISQVQSYYNSRNILKSRFTYDPGLLCSQTPLYSQTNEDIETLSRTKINLFADKNYEVLENYSTFYEPNIKQEYNSLYSDYKNSLSIFENKFQEIQSIPYYLNYMNVWIETCTTFQESPNLEEIRLTCNQFLGATTVYKDSKNLPIFWSEVEGYINDAVSLCQNYATSTPAEFIRKWVEKYDQIKRYQPDLYNNQAELDAAKAEIDASLKQTIADIRSVRDKKRSFTGIWYLLSRD